MAKLLKVGLDGTLCSANKHEIFFGSITILSNREVSRMRMERWDFLGFQQPSMDDPFFDRENRKMDRCLLVDSSYATMRASLCLRTNQSWTQKLKGAPTTYSIRRLLCCIRVVYECAGRDDEPFFLTERTASYMLSA